MARLSISITCLLLALSAALPAQADDNSLVIRQIGNRQSAEVMQEGQGNEATLLQGLGGADDAAWSRIPNAAALGTLADALVSASADNRARLEQRGAGNAAILVQHGFGNEMTTLQQGAGNKAFHAQIGDGNESTLEEIGNNNSAALAIIGSDNSYALRLIGDNLRGVGITVRGNGVKGPLAGVTIRTRP